MAEIDDEGWLCSDGGPLMITTVAKKATWGGIYSSSASVGFPQVNNDYARACRLSSSGAAILSDNDGEVIVIFSEKSGGAACFLNGKPSFVIQECRGEERDLDVSEIDKVKFLYEEKSSVRLVNFIKFGSTSICLMAAEEDGVESLSKNLEIKDCWYCLKRTEFNIEGFIGGVNCGLYTIYYLEEVDEESIKHYLWGFNDINDAPSA